MTSPEAQAVLAHVSNFEALISQLLVSDNVARKHAEQLFEQCKAAPDACISLLVQVLRQSRDEQYRSFAAIMLRKALTKDSPPLWGNINDNTKALVKHELLQSIGLEELKPVRKKVCDTVSEVVITVYDSGGWPEILPFLFECLRANQDVLLESALSILGNIAADVIDDAKPNMPALLQYMAVGLSHQNQDVQMAAMRATSAFIRSFESAQEREQLQPLINPMLGCLGRSLTSGDEASAQEALEMWIDVAEVTPKFIRKQLKEVVDAMLTVVKAPGLEPQTRQLAAEFLVTLCEAREKAPGMMRKLPNFTAELFSVMMEFLLDVEDEAPWHEGDSDVNEEAGAGFLYDIAQEYLDRIAIAMGGNALVPCAAAVLPVWLSDADWRKRHATLICLAQIAEGCAKVMLTQLDALVGMCEKGLTDPSPKVRWAACQALGQMCTDLGPDIQAKQHARILPSLMAVMDDFSSPRVQAHSSAAVVNFSEAADAEILPPYLDTLITKLLSLLRNGKRIVQEGALTALASVADCAQDMFVKYYDTVMPLLSQLLLSATERAHRLLRAKALECISLVGMAVGKDRFRADAHNVMGLLQQLYSSQLDSDDPTSSYMLQAGARICKCLGQEFLPYLGIVMPSLLRSAAVEPDVKVVDPDDDTLDDDDDDDDDVERIQLGDKLLCLRTSNLEEKATACSMLRCYADELKQGFYPYTQQVLDIMLPLIKFYFHEEVRRAAVETLPELLRSAVLSVGSPGGADVGVVRGMAATILPALVAVIAREPDSDVQAAMLASVAEVVELVEAAWLEQGMVEAAFKSFEEVMKASEERRAERRQRIDAEDFDEEEMEQLEIDNAVEEELFDQVGTCVGALLKKFSDAVWPYVEGLVMPLVGPMLLDRVKYGSEDRRIAVCIVDDVLEHSPAGRAKYHAQITPILLDALADDNPQLRQCAAYGIAVLASKGRDLFRPYVPEAMPRLLAQLARADAREDDDAATATDNVASALGRLLQHHGEGLDGAHVGATWLATLPLTADTVEAQAMHELLVELVEANDRRVLGEGNAQVAKIAVVMMQVLGGGTELISETAAPRLVALLQLLQQTPAAATAVQEAYHVLDAKQKASFQAYMSGQRPA